MATLTQITKQAQAIAQECQDLQSILQNRSLRNFFASDTGETAIMAQASSLGSYPIVMFGLREYNLQFLGESVLPDKSTLESKSNNWLNPDDIVLGWMGYTTDKPRVIKSMGIDGYTWRYLDDDASVSRSPVTLNRFFQSRGFIQFQPATTTYQEQIDEIYALQANELTQLQGYKDYFQNKEYLAA